MAELVVMMDGVETQHVHLNKDRTMLGRRHHNDIALTDLSVSGMHCVFERHGPSEIWLKDLGSTNGTFINGERVSRQRLNDQDLILIGVYKVQFLLDPAPVDAGRTSPMRLESLGAPGTDGALQASLQVLTGASAGRSVPLVKTVTTFGQPGEAVMSISHRRNGYYAALVEGGAQVARLNGMPLGSEARALADQDKLELAGIKMLFILG